MNEQTVQEQHLGGGTVPDPSDHKELFEAAFKGAHTGMALIAADGRYLQVNEALCEMLGYPAEALHEMRWQQVTHPDDLARNTEETQSLFNDHSSGRMTLRKRYIRADGTELWAHVSDAVVRAPSGEARFVVTQVQDVSHELRSEREKQLLETQLQHAQRMEAVGHLAGGVAHDFNNILAIVSGYLDLMRIELAGHRVVADIDEAVSAVDRGAGLVRRLLDFSRPSEGNPELVDLNRCVNEMMPMLDKLIPGGITLEAYLWPDLWKTRIDRSMLEQVMCNLVVNARDALLASGRITIETSNAWVDRTDTFGVQPGSYVCLTVRDNGQGMNVHVQGRIFDPFFTTKPPGEGSGLGLPVVYGIAHAAGGGVSVHSTEGVGTSMRVFLPVASEAVQLDQAPLTTTDTNCSVLIVDDEEGVLRVTERVLRKAGYRVTTAGSPGTAAKLCASVKEPFDILLTDVVMPEESGVRLAGRLREQGAARHTIFMSGFPREDLDEDEFFVAKPFTAHELLKTIRSVA